MPKVSALYIYPLKSAKGIQLDKMEIISTGPKYDREWMLVNNNLSFISQRTHPSMGLLKTQITENDLIVENPQGQTIKIELTNYGAKKIDDFKLFGKTVGGVKIDKQYDSFFSDFLGEPVSLVRTPSQKPRRTSGNHGPITPVNFPDGYPFLLTNEATLEELNQKMDSPVEMLRFRPNIIIDGIKAGGEDQWQEFEINGVHFHSVKACSRCSIIDIEPGTTKKSNSITKTLKTYRLKDGQVVFGQNLSHTNTGSIEIGQELNSIKFRPNDSNTD